MTNRPCAECTNVELCDMLERCIKHDPTPKMHDPYKPLACAEHLDPCPICGAAAQLWQFSKTETDPVQRLVCCTHGDAIGPHRTRDAKLHAVA